MVNLRRILRRVIGKHQRRVAIFHCGRCGSTVLERMLKQHPDIWPDSEIYARAYDDARTATPELSARQHTLNQFQAALTHHPERQVYAFEMKVLPGLDLRHFADDLGTCFDFLISNGMEQCVVLERKNTLRRLVSTVIATQTGVWHKSNPVDTSSPPVVLDVDRVHLGRVMPLVPMIDHIEAAYRDLRHALDSRMPDRLDLCYEDDILGNPKVAYDKVVDWCGLQDAPAEATLSRTQTKSLRDTLANFDQVADTLHDTRHAWMLDTD